MKLVWFPTWKCQNYEAGKSHSRRCPYCPYGYDAEKQKVLYEGIPCSNDGYVSPEYMSAFLSVNAEKTGSFVEISGGEPLLYRGLTEILRNTGYTWAITSNSVNTRNIRAMADADLMKTLVQWNGSYHPCSDRDEEYRKAAEILAEYGHGIHVTVVVSKYTLDRLEHTKKFLASIPHGPVVYHLDTHTPLSDDEKKRAEDIIGRVKYEAGEPKRNVLCDVTGSLLAIGPDGSLYRCVTHCYTGKDPIHNIKNHIKLPEPSGLELCHDECFACCDWIKHRGH